MDFTDRQLIQIAIALDERIKRLAVDDEPGVWTEHRAEAEMARIIVTNERLARAREAAAE